MKHYRVQIVEDAEHDLIDIYHYIAFHDSPENADYVIDQLESLWGATRLPRLLSNQG